MSSALMDALLPGSPPRAVDSAARAGERRDAFAPALDHALRSDERVAAAEEGASAANLGADDDDQRDGADAVGETNADDADQAATPVGETSAQETDEDDSDDGEEIAAAAVFVTVKPDSPGEAAVIEAAAAAAPSVPATSPASDADESLPGNRREFGDVILDPPAKVGEAQATAKTAAQVAGSETAVAGQARNTKSAKPAPSGPANEQHTEASAAAGPAADGAAELASELSVAPADAAGADATGPNEPGNGDPAAQSLEPQGKEAAFESSSHRENAPDATASRIDEKLATPAVEPAASSRSETTLARLTAERAIHTSGASSDDGGAPDRARFVGRVEGALRAAQQRDDGRIQVRLSPPELGSLRIELTIQQGALAARLEAETPAARNLLLDNLPALRERLAQQEIRIERFDVDLRQDANGGGAGQHGAQDRLARDAEWRPGTPRTNRGGTISTATPAAPSGAGLASNTALDVRV